MSSFDSCPPSSPPRNTESPVQEASPHGGVEEPARSLDENLDTVEAAVQKVLHFAEATAQHLARTVEGDHDAGYYLRMIFARGTYLHPPPPAVPHFFAVADVPAAELRLRREFIEEFSRLTGEDKRILVDVLMTQGAPTLEDLIVRSPPSSRAQDVDRVLRIIKGLILFLKCQCGVEGFVCLVKNNKACKWRPQWFFSSPNIDQYLSCVVDKWDASLIARRLEAFALSGCNMDASGLTAAHLEYPKWLRHEIQEKIDTLLTQTTGVLDATMDYAHYEKAIIIRFGIVLVGWTHEIWACPSELPLDVEPLETLLEAVNTGKCYFRRLSEEEHLRCIDEFMEHLAAKARKEHRRRGRTTRVLGN